MAEVILWTSFAFILYAYFGYPVLLRAMAAFRNKPVSKAPVQPKLSLIIAAHNEQDRIREKLDNALSINYPSEHREIIVTSDGSTDRTNEIVLSYAHKGVRLITRPERHGKEYAQRRAIDAASGSILVFSDVATILEKNSLACISENFHDQSIGCVSSEDRIVADSGAIEGEGAYVKYEMLLRRLESRVNSLVGLSGSFFAVRRELCQNWSTTLPSDFVLVIQAVKQGYRAISDPSAIGYYKTVHTEKEEFQRKVRTVMRGIAVVMTYPEILNPLKYGFFSIQFISHKLLRWLVPFFMVSAFLSNIPLMANSSVYQGIFTTQLAFYALAALGFSVARLNQRLFFKIPLFLMLSNLSIAIAWIRYFAGQRVVLWDPSRR
jgi:cellulose synthase/poly-beta-1,6-N-acetylglucosamine synthase-like glycosyltransferase